MKVYNQVVIFCIFLLTSDISYAALIFPTGPDEGLTPGAVCINSNERRYPEKIFYCNRDVDRNEKWAVIEAYEKKFNFIIDNSNRAQFKIDHYIPLCMGGSNSLQNLWPQHKNVFTISDPLEVVLCQQLAVGKITQKFAIEKIKQGKKNYLTIPSLIRELIKIK